MERADRHVGTAVSAAVALAALLLICVFTPSARAADVVYGVVPQDGALPTQDDMKMMPSGGIGSIRTILPWSIVQPSEGATYDWSGIDEIVRQETSNGLVPFPFLYGTPEWAAAIDGRKCVADECAVYPPKSEATRKAFADFAAAAAKRYGPGGAFWTVPINQTKAYQRGLLQSQVLQLPPCNPPLLVPPLCEDEPTPPPDPPPGDPTPTPPPIPPTPTPTGPLDPQQPPCQCTEAHPIMTWQVWNEQNSPKYFAPKASVGKYGKLLKATGDAIHGAVPDADVILGGMWGPSSAKKVVIPVNKYLKKLYKVHDIKDSFDSIALHPYASSAKASEIALTVAHNVVKKAHDKSVGTWITEIGWAAGGPKKNPYVKGKTGQAKVLSDALKRYKKHEKRDNLRGVFWYSWRDKPGGDLICEWCGYAGLRAKNGTAKPAWDAFVKVANG